MIKQKTEDENNTIEANITNRGDEHLQLKHDIANNNYRMYLSQICRNKLSIIYIQNNIIMLVYYIYTRTCTLNC